MRRRLYDICKCGELTRQNQRDCNYCHAAYMRKWREANRLTITQKLKDNARSYAGVYLRRGIIEKSLCRDCGSAESQMHHEDYTKPLNIVWLCRPCHIELHKEKDLIINTANSLRLKEIADKFCNNSRRD